MRTPRVDANGNATMKVTVVLNAEQIARIKDKLGADSDFSDYSFRDYIEALAQAAVDGE